MIKEIYQYRNVMHINYIPHSKKLTMNIQDTNDDYVSQADEIDMDAFSDEFKFIKNISIRKDYLSVDFSKPIHCNLESGRYEHKMICNVQIEGENRSALVEKIPGLEDRIF